MSNKQLYLYAIVIALLIVGGWSFRYWQVKTTLTELTGKEPTTSKVLWYMTVWGR
jgi:hypothetical protein